MYTKELKEKISSFDNDKKMEIYEFIQSYVSEMLELDKDDVKEDSLLINELGLMSIDFLDLTYSLENKFNINIPRNGIRENISEVITEDEFVKDSVITEKGLELLKFIFDGDAKGRIKEGLREHQIISLFSIKTFVDLTIAQIILSK